MKVELPRSRAQIRAVTEDLIDNLRAEQRYTVFCSCRRSDGELQVRYMEDPKETGMQHTETVLTRKSDGEVTLLRSGDVKANWHFRQGEQTEGRYVASPLVGRFRIFADRVAVEETPSGMRFALEYRFCAVDMERFTNRVQITVEVTER